MTRLAGWARRRAAGGEESGFTLIELLVVVVVLPLILGGLAAMTITVFENTAPKDPGGTATRLADSHDAQLSSAYFVRDVQGAASVSTSGLPLCAPSSAAGSQVVGLQWSAGSQTVDVSYFLQTSPAALLRYYCVSPGTPSSYPVTTATASTVASNVFSNLTSAAVGSCPASGFGSGATSCVLSGTSAYVAVTVACYSGSCSTGTNPGMAVSPAASGTPGIATVTLQVKEGLSGYQYRLVGAPRGSNAASGGPPPGFYPPFIANGPMSIGNCSILVNGLMAVNDSSNGSVTLGPQGTASSTGIYTTDPTPSGSVSGPSGSYPTPVMTGNPVASAYDGLTEPPTAPAGAGYPVVTESASNWDPSKDATIETNGVLNATTFPHGAIFVVTNGMSVSKGFSAPQGVLFYVTGGNVSLNGNGNLNLNSLSPSFESPTQPVPEVALWISRTDTSPNNPPTLTLGGNGNTTLINGAVYAPTAALTMNGGGSSGGVGAQAFDIGSLAACHGGGAVAYNITVGSPLGTGITVAAGSTSVPTGGSTTATISVQGVGLLHPTGTVSIYQCGPTLPSDGCGQTPGWTPIASGSPGANQVGSAVALTASPSPGVSTGTSVPFTPPAAGTYCFAAYYSGDGSYTASSDTTPDGCFTVSGPAAPQVTSPQSGVCYKAAAGAGCQAWPSTGISGTASDPGGPGLAAVAVAIQGPSGAWWNGVSFSSATAVNIPATDTSGNGSWATWALPFPSSNLPSGSSAGTSYTIVVTSTDKATVSGLSGSVTVTWKG